MIHPSTMAGPHWFTGSFGTINPFQQSSPTFFRTAPFAGPQGWYGPGINPFQNPPFGLGPNPPQLQNMINEIVRQTVSTTLAGFGIPTTGIATPLGFGPPGVPIPTGPAPFGPQFPTPPWTNPMFNIDLSEIIRQATNQAIQNVAQQHPGLFTPFTMPIGGAPGFLGTTPQQNLANYVGQVCTQACQNACQTIYQAMATCANEYLNQQSQALTTPPGWGLQSQNFLNLCAQTCQQACQAVSQTICQAVATCVNETLNVQSRAGRPAFAGTPGTPFASTGPSYGFSNASSPFATAAGIPAGAGAF